MNFVDSSNRVIRTDGAAIGGWSWRDSGIDVHQNIIGNNTYRPTKSEQETFE